MKKVRGTLPCTLKGMLVTFAVFASPYTASAQQHCKLGTSPPASGQIKVKLSCQPTPGPQTAPYPAGPLYVGLSLYKLPSSVGRAVAPFTDEDAESAFHAEAQEIRGPAASLELTFRLPARITQTHMLVAVWDQKNACTEGSRCGPGNSTFGKVDRDSNPIPVDVLPLPLCNITALEARGFFKWSDTADWASPGEDEEMMDLARLNDCWMRSSAWPGRGLSYRKWRVAPLPR